MQDPPVSSQLTHIQGWAYNPGTSWWPHLSLGLSFLLHQVGQRPLPLHRWGHRDILTEQEARSDPTKSTEALGPASVPNCAVP